MDLGTHPPMIPIGRRPKLRLCCRLVHRSGEQNSSGTVRSRPIHLPFRANTNTSAKLTAPTEWLRASRSNRNAHNIPSSAEGILCFIPSEESCGRTKVDLHQIHHEEDR